MGDRPARRGGCPVVGRERTGWDLAVAAGPEVIAAATAAEFDALRNLQRRTHDH